MMAALIAILWFLKNDELLLRFIHVVLKMHEMLCLAGFFRKNPSLSRPGHNVKGCYNSMFQWHERLEAFFS